MNLLSRSRTMLIKNPNPIAIIIVFFVCAALTFLSFFSRFVLSILERSNKFFRSFLLGVSISDIFSRNDEVDTFSNIFWFFFSTSLLNLAFFSRSSEIVSPSFPKHSSQFFTLICSIWMRNLIFSLLSSVSPIDLL